MDGDGRWSGQLTMPSPPKMFLVDSRHWLSNVKRACVLKRWFAFRFEQCGRGRNGVTAVWTGKRKKRIIQKTRWTHVLVCVYYIDVVQNRLQNDVRNKRLDLFRRRQHNLEEEHAELEYQIRVLMAQPEHTKTDSEKAREEELIQRSVWPTYCITVILE